MSVRPRTIMEQEGHMYCDRCAGDLTESGHYPECPTLTAACSICPQECHCMKCHRDYPVWYAPNNVWNLVMRDQDGDEAMPFVCMDCFAFLFEQRDGTPRRWKLVLE